MSFPTPPIVTQQKNSLVLARIGAYRGERWVCLFFLCLFLLISSGRLGNWDPRAQLQAATALVSIGRLSVAEHPLPAVPDLWIKNDAGRYYQAHDLGGTLFMVPAAAVGVLVTPHQSVMERIREPAWAARALVSLQYAVLAAVGCGALFRLFSGFYAPRTAFLLTLVFAGGTTYGAYARIAFDVLGACVGVCLLLTACADTLRCPTVTLRDMVRVILAFSLTCTFRFSLTPFLFLALVAVVFLLRHRWNRRQWIAGGALVGLGLLASLLYNYVRTAELFKNGATGSWPASAALRGDFGEGVYGLLLSPNWGLLWYSPVFVLLLALPFTWKRLPVVVRQLFLCFGPAALLYILVIARLNNWTGNNGWGPRYLVPFLPILFLPVAAVIVEMWPRHKRWLAGLILLTLLVNLPSLLVYYSLAIDGHPGGRERFAPVPRQQFAVWKALGYGLRNEPLPAPAYVTGDPIRRLGRSFPDWWTFRLMGLSPGGAVLGSVITVALALGGLASLRAFLVSQPDAALPIEGEASERASE